MKILSFISLFFVLQNFALSQELSWENSLKRELSFIESQKKVLSNQLEEYTLTQEKQQSRLKKELDDLRKQIDFNTEELSILNTQIEDLKKWQNLKFEKIFTKTIKIENELQSLANQKKVESTEKDPSHFDDLLPHFININSLLHRLDQVERIKSIIIDNLNNEEKLQESTVLRLGSFLSYKEESTAASLSMLAPTDFGFLKKIDSQSLTIRNLDSQFIVTSGFIYDQFQKSQKYLKPKNWADRIVDFIPGLFLALVFTFVGWIFLVLAKI